MNTIFTCAGNKKSAITPRTILLGAYSASASYDSVTSVGALPLSPQEAAVLADVQSLNSPAALASRISTIDVAIADLTLFEKQTRAYYDSRVSRTSGGKRDRLRAERADLCNQALAEIALLRSARASAVRRATSLSTSKQSDFNPDTGAALTPVEKQTMDAQAAASAPSMSSLIIPVGAALAALFFLKGH